MTRAGLRVLAVAVSSAGLMAAAAVAGAEAMNNQEHVRVADLTPVTLHAVTTHAPVSIVEDGKARAVIHVAIQEPGEKLQVLVDELVEVIRLSTGAQLERVDALPSADVPAIIIGASVESDGLIDASAIPIEGFRVLTVPNRVHLVGSTQGLPYSREGMVTKHHPYANDGTAWAVADFLERVVGVRWYWPLEAGGRSIRRAESLMIPPTHYADAPVFPMRTHHPPFSYRAPWKSRWFDKGHVPVEFQDSEAAADTDKPAAAEYPRLPVPDGLKELDMSALLTFLRSGNSWPYQLRVHEPQRLWSRGSEFVQENEEIFAIAEDGSRNHRTYCYSGSAFLEFLLAGCEQQWDKGGNVSWVTSSSVTVSPPDLPVRCFCDTCRERWQPGNWRGTASHIMADFVQRFAQEVERRWPDKKVIYLPYWNYTNLAEGYEFPANLEIQVASNFPQGLGELKYEQARADTHRLLRDWSGAAGGRISTWEFSLSITGWVHAPVQFPNVVQRYYRENRDILAGSFLNGGNVAEWSRTAPTLYVWMKVLWNPEIDVDAVLAEMCRRLFGAASEPAHALLLLMIERYENAPWPTRMGDAGRVSDGIYMATWPPEVVDEMQALRREAEGRVDPNSLERQRLDYWLWAFDAFVEEARQREAALTAGE